MVFINKLLFAVEVKVKIITKVNVEVLNGRVKLFFTSVNYALIVLVVVTVKMYSLFVCCNNRVY